MKINRFFIAILSCFLVINTAETAYYKAAPLAKGSSCVNDRSTDELFFEYKVFSDQDCKKYLNSNKIIRKGFQPIQITFINNSKNTVSLLTRNFSLNCIPAQDVAYSLHKNGVARGVGFGIGSLFLWPLIIPAIIEGFGARGFNNQVDTDFSNKELKNQIVRPYSKVTGIIFVSRYNFTNDFTLTIRDENHKDLVLYSYLQDGNNMASCKSANYENMYVSSDLQSPDVFASRLLLKK